MIAHHYSSEKITDIDLSKCENGFWFTSIDPKTLKELQTDGLIGCAGCSYAHEIEFNDDDVGRVLDSDIAHIEDYLSKNEEKIAVFGYEDLEAEIEYSDYVTFDSSKIKILSVTLL